MKVMFKTWDGDYLLPDKNVLSIDIEACENTDLKLVKKKGVIHIEEVRNAK